MRCVELPKLAALSQNDAVYAPKILSRSEFLTLRGRRYHLRRWGNPDAPLLILLHGWMDVSATFQLVVDHLKRDWNIVAPDWAGFGLSEGHAGGYYLTDYLADLDSLLQHVSPNRPVNILAHSMGANVATIYAGVRPKRVSKIVNMEGLGPVPGLVKHAADMMSMWLASQREPEVHRSYRSVSEFAQRLVKANDQLPMAYALFLAGEFTQKSSDGCYHLRAEPSVRAMLPLYPHREQVIEYWGRVSAKVLFLLGSSSFVSRAIEQYPGELRSRMEAIADYEEVTLEGATHNMQHEQPELIATTVEQFLA